MVRLLEVLWVNDELVERFALEVGIFTEVKLVVDDLVPREDAEILFNDCAGE